MAPRTTKPPADALAERTLTNELLAELRRPFTTNMIRFKPQVVTKDKTKAMATFYIDARLAAERLNAVVGTEGWTDDYHLLFEQQTQACAAAHFPVECRLTVLGVTKVDVGNYQATKPDDKALKSSYSDALKRAAVKFGVGAYLYGFPKVWAPVDVKPDGKVAGFSKAGEAQLRKAYDDACKQMAERFGEPLDHGFLEAGDPELDEYHAPEPAADTPPEPPAPEAAPPAATSEPAIPEAEKATKDEVLALKALAQKAGFTNEEVLHVFTTEHEGHGCYRKSWLLEQERMCRLVAGAAA